MFTNKNFNFMGRAVLVAAAFLACVLTGCTRQTELLPSSPRPDGYRAAGGFAMYMPEETKSVLNNNSNGIGLNTYAVVEQGVSNTYYRVNNWIACIYNSNGDREDWISDPINGIDFHYPHAHVSTGNPSADIPYIYGYLDDTYTVFIVCNIPCDKDEINDEESLQTLANNMFPVRIENVNGHLNLLSDFSTSEGATGYQALKDFGYMPMSCKKTGFDFLTAPEHSLAGKSLFYTLNLKVLPDNYSSSMEDIYFDFENAYIRNMAAEIDVFADGQSAASTFDDNFEHLLNNSEKQTLINGGIVSFYCLENCQGTVSGITTSKDRNPDKLRELGYGTVADNATYVEVLIDNFCDGKLDGASGYLRYYLGHYSYTQGSANSYSDFNVKRNESMNLELNPTVGEFLENSWQAGFNGQRSHLAYSWQNHGTSPMVKLNSGDTDRISFSGYYCGGIDDFQYSLSIYNCTFSGGAWNGTHNYSNFADFNSHYRNYYEDMQGFSIYKNSGKIVVSTVGSSNIPLSNSNEYWILTVTDPVSGDSVDIGIGFNHPSSSTIPELTTSVLEAYVGQVIDFTASSSCRWVLTDVGQAVGGSYSNASVMSTSSSYNTSSNSLLCKQPGKVSLHLVNSNNQERVYTVNILEPKLQYYSPQNEIWCDLGSFFTSKIYFDTASRSVNFRYVGQNGANIPLSSFNSDLFSELLELNVVTTGPIFSCSHIACSYNRSSNSMQAQFIMDSINEERNDVLKEAALASNFENHGVATIAPKFTTSSPKFVRWQFNYISPDNGWYKFFGNSSTKRWVSDNRFFFSSSASETGYCSVGLPVSVENKSSIINWSLSNFNYNITEVSVSSIGSISGTMGNYVIDNITSTIGKYCGPASLTFGVRSASGATWSSSSWHLYLDFYLSIGVGMYTKMFGSSWYMFPVFFNRNSYADPRDYIGGVSTFGQNMDFSLTSVISEHLTNLGFTYAYDGSAYYFPSMRSDQPGDCMNLTEIYTNYNSYGLSNPSSAFSEGYLSNYSEFYKYYPSLFGELLSEYAQGDYGADEKGEFVYVPSRYVKLYNFYNRDF